jgi:N-acetylneuraminic acid mutarotase
MRSLIMITAAALLSGCLGSDDIQSLFPPPPTTYSWSEATAAAAFAGRDGAGAVVLGGKAFLLGGWRWASNGGVNFPQTGAPGCCTTSEVWSSTDGAHWQLLTVAPWRPRHMAGWVAFNNKIWVVGGDNNSGSYESDVWNSPDGINWTQVTNNVPWSPRVLHYVVAFNGALWVIGGQQLYETLVPPPDPYPTEPVYYSDVWRSTDGAHWENVGDVLPHAIGMICGSVVFNDQLWIIGGGQYADGGLAIPGTAYSEVWSSANGTDWTAHPHPDAPWPNRRYHNVQVFDGKLWVMAGIDAQDVSDKSDVWYSPDGDTWTELPDTPWIARHAATTFALNGQLFLTGGTDNGQLQHNDVWALTASAN